MSDEATNTAPWPTELSELVNDLTYKPRWMFDLGFVDRSQGSRGLTLSITITTPDSYDHDKMRSVLHLFPVPPAAFNLASWRRWLLEQILLVEQHEACEFFTIGDLKPYAPNHGPGNDPYVIREMTSDEERRTSFRGQVKQG